VSPDRFVVIVVPAPTVEQGRSLAGLAGCRRWDGNGHVTFSRDQRDLATAVASALRDVEAVGLRPVRLIDHDWVTLADIASRLGRSRESVRLWAVGRIGPGAFPPPLNPGGKTSYFSWVEVVGWLRDRAGMEVAEAERALVVANLTVRLRSLVPQSELLRTPLDV
jgi:hypothetical protein